MSDITSLFTRFTPIETTTPTVTIPEFNLPIVATAQTAKQRVALIDDNKTSESNSFLGFYDSGATTSSSTSSSSTSSSSTSSSSTSSSSTSSSSNSSGGYKARAAEFIKLHENFVDHRVPDAKSYSIGYGFYGTTYWKGNTITRAQADLVLNKILDDNEKYLAKYPVWDKLNDNQKAALQSYIYNVGPGHASEKTTLGKALASGDLNKIRSAINITTSNHKRLEGLVKRREEERNLFSS